MIQVITPNAQGQQAEKLGEVSSMKEVKHLEKIKIAYLSNGKPNVQEIFTFIDQHIFNEYPKQVVHEPFEVRFFDKKNAAKPAPPEMLEEIKDYADILITGSAD
jgi:hypothetical protein